MCHLSCIEFGRSVLSKELIRGKSVLEVGSLNVNGSLRQIIESFHPSSYIGFDICEGAGVDVVGDAADLLAYFHDRKFDLLVSTELLEHVRDWQRVVGNMKNILEAEGKLLLTTRSKGVPFHGYPFDFWRYEIDDIRNVFSDFNIEDLRKDPIQPGVFLLATKPKNFRSLDISNVKAYSVIKGREVDSVSDFDMYWFRLKWRILYRPMQIIKKMFLAEKSGTYF